MYSNTMRHPGFLFALLFAFLIHLGIILFVYNREPESSSFQEIASENVYNLDREMSSPVAYTDDSQGDQELSLTDEDELIAMNEQFETPRNVDELQPPVSYRVKQYEQLLTLWFEQQKRTLPKEMRLPTSGSATIRISLDRDGNIIHAEFIGTTSSKEVDSTVRELVKHSSPVPAVPSDFPKDQPLHFIIPIVFTNT